MPRLNLLKLSIMLCLGLTITATSFAGVTDSLSYQGRLTDASENPVPDGPHDMVLSIWNDSIGGTMLNSEIVVVTTNGGLFSTCIGCASATFIRDFHTDPYVEDALYLQVQIPGQPPIMPRSRLRAVPFSISADGVHSEATDGFSRARGIVITKPGSGTSSSMGLSVDIDDDDDPESGIESVVTPGTSSVAIKVKGTGADKDRVHINVGQDSTRLELATGPDGNPNGGIELNVLPTTSSMAINRKGTGADPNRVVITTYPDSAVQVISSDADGDGNAELLQKVEMVFKTVEVRMTVDDDDDGDPDGEIESLVTPTTSSAAITTKGTGADKNKIIGTTYPDSAVHIVSSSAGAKSASVTATASPGGIRSSMQADGDNDGNPEARSGTLNVSATPGGSAVASHSMSVDNDDDGIPDGEIESIVLPTTSSVAITTKGTGADKNRIAMSADTGGANFEILDSNTTTGGNSYARWSTCCPSPGHTTLRTRMGTDDDGDGDPDGEIESIVTPTTSSVAITTKGTGADKNRVISTTTPDSVTHELLYDNDQPGSEITVQYKKTMGQLAGKKRSAAYTPSDTTISDEIQTPDSLIEEVSIKGSGGGGGGAGGSYSYGAKAGKTGRARRSETFNVSARSLSTEMQTPDSSVEESSHLSGGALRLHYKAKQGSTGATKRCAFTGPSSSSDIDEDCDDFESSLRLSHSEGPSDMDADVVCDGLSSSVSVSSSSVVKSSMSSNGTVYASSSVGVNVPNPSHPIEHSSGAHLTVGGTWTNMSDKNLKENFERVDGEAILEQIADLPISRWNYKAENETVTHIGPTAQDFKKAFDVGGSDKSISTIDPAGVALVAIKELKKENDQLRKELKELRKMIMNLKK